MHKPAIGDVLVVRVGHGSKLYQVTGNRNWPKGSLRAVPGHYGHGTRSLWWSRNAVTIYSHQIIEVRPRKEA